MNCPKCEHENCALEHEVGNAIMVLSHIHKSLIHDHRKGVVRKEDDVLYAHMLREINRIEKALKECNGHSPHE